MSARGRAVWSLLALAVVLLAGPGTAFAQDPADEGSEATASGPDAPGDGSATAEPDAAAVPDADKPWYALDFLRWGGGSSVGGQLGSDAIERKPLIRVAWLDDQLRRYRGWKARVQARIGLAFGTDYSALYQVATQRRANEGASGAWRAFGTWDLLGRDTDYTGSLVFRVENRHRLGARRTPAQLGPAIGSVLSTAVGYNSRGWGLSTLYWVQRFGRRVTLSAGQLDPSDFVSPSALLNRLTAFTGAAFGASNPAIATPGAGLGASIGLVFDRFIVGAAFTDANGEATRPFAEAFAEGEFFKILLLAWYGKWERRRFDNVHVTLWHVDEREKAGIPAGWGVAGSATWLFRGRWAPFLRVGWSKRAARLKGLVAGGLGVQVRGGDMVGLGLSWSRPSEKDLRDQYGIELFYRLQLIANLAVTPDVQILFDPARETTSVVAVFGLRARVAF